MDQDHPFVLAIRENPHDDDARLVYADWLDDAGSPQADLIRVQVDLARLLPGESERIGLVKEEQLLLERYGDLLLEPMRRLGAVGVSTRSFRRGLIERATFPAAAFLDGMEEICRVNPALTQVEIRDLSTEIDDLAGRQFPAQLHELDLSKNKLTAAEIIPLIGAPWWKQLRTLHLAFNALGDEGATELGEIEAPRLTRLDLGVNRIGPEGARMLAASPLLASCSLRHLALPLNQLEAAGVEHLNRCRSLRGLESLDLSSNKIRAEALRSLVKADWFGELRTLAFRGNQIENWDAFASFLQDARGTRLEQIDLRNNGKTNQSRYGYGRTDRPAQDQVIRLQQELAEDGITVLL
ncbi:TIGR02996 domain-containing protein [Lignipirellula cremea]|uniref:Leucine Rich repeats (2 copies) n=1 Tax=Lignipirellula cremea TaxID=2528010 RepID=A0A518DP52_9BACT|nr:TIGR02996 domain-containing protein [Lignipirellula cremea]QDU93615.1 Leucine Rich repeats (2 copies) [Lignipirellula cremea]